MRHDELYVADLVDSTRAVREYLDGTSMADLPGGSAGPGRAGNGHHASGIPGAGKDLRARNDGRARSGTNGVTITPAATLAELERHVRVRVERRARRFR